MFLNSGYMSCPLVLIDTGASKYKVVLRGAALIVYSNRCGKLN